MARMNGATLAVGLESFASLLEAGLPVQRALASLADSAPPAWHPVVAQLLRDVRNGTSLASAFREAPIELPPAVLGALGAADAGVGLPQAMAQAARLARARASAADALRSALAYPLVLLTTGVLAVTFLIGFVLPRFADVLRDAGQRLPASTAFLVAVGASARVLAVPTLLGSAALGVWTVQALREPAVRERWHAWLLTLPGVGRWRLSHATAQGCATLGALLQAGVTLPVALQFAGDATGDLALARRYRQVVNEVRHGEPLSRSVTQTQAMTPGAAGLLRVGEETGRLPALALHAAGIEQAAAMASLKALTQLIEPALILGFGGGVGLVAMGLLQAVYAVRPS
jgi:general secretion pathway protein F